MVNGLHHLKVALVRICVYTCPQLQRKPVEVCLKAKCADVLLQTLSEGLGTGGKRDGVGHRLLWVAAVVVNLEEDGKVHHNLQQATCPELHGSLGEQEVSGLKGVAARPHQHHLNARRESERWNHVQKETKTIFHFLV